MQSKLSVNLVSWNAGQYVPHLFASLRAQVFKNWELLVIDNNSSDDTVSKIEAELKSFPVPARVIKNKANDGFAKGHNQGLRATSPAAEYVLMLNQDMYLAPDCLEKLVYFLDTNPLVAAASARLMRWDFAKISSLGLEKSLSGYIDALGLKLFKNRRVIEQYTGQLWDDVWRDPLLAQAGGGLAVFGVSGAFPVFRRSALRAVSFSDGTFFDEAHFMYKEDVDVAYRLRAAGFNSAVVLGAVAHHDRTGAGPREMGDRAAAKNKKLHNHTVRYYSYKNHLAVLYKNEYGQNFLLDFPFIFWYELKKFLYFLLFDRTVLKGLAEIWRMRRELKIKRLQIKNLRKVGWREIRRWW